MSEAKHTPGPWEVQPNAWDQGASIAIVSPANGWKVAIIQYDEDIQIVNDPDMETVKRHPQEMADAHLIAAAPDLLQALQNLIKDYKALAEDFSHERTKDGWDAFDPAEDLKAAHAAITKATA